MVGYDFTFRIMLLSDSEVDKSCVLPEYFQQTPPLTIGVDFWSRTLDIDKKKIKLQIWDIGGDERFRFLLYQYCKGANAAFLLYDVTKPQTLNNMEELIKIVRQYSGDIPIMLVGVIGDEKNKQQVSAEKGEEIAKSKNLYGFIEINARTRENVEKAYETITRLILANEEYQTPIKMKKYEEFIVYDLENTGNRTKLNITLEELQYHLNPKKVLIIFHEDLRRIFIWKGLKSPVRKRFIASRVAQDLQRELMEDARYPRSKIVSIFQGEEPQEFLNAFGLKFLEKFKALSNQLEIPGTSYRIQLGIVNEKWVIRLLKGKDVIDSYVFKEEDMSSSGFPNHNLIVGWVLRTVAIPNINPHQIMKTTQALTKQAILDAEKQFRKMPFKVEDDDDDPRFPYPYIFKPPEPPDDFAMAPQSQLRAPLKEKEPEEEIYCQYCGIKLTKEEEITHSCKKKPKTM